MIFEIAAVSISSLLLAFPDRFGTLSLSSEVSESTSCLLSDNERRTAQPAVASTAITASWFLGLALGRDAVLRQWSSANRDLLEKSASGIQHLAATLDVPAPSLFSPRQSADANREFVSFVEADSRGTAHALAVGYSPRACQLYKLGTVWGYSEIVRPALPGERAVFALEIHYYAQHAGLPEPLWKPMLEPTPRNTTDEDVIAETTALTNNLTAHLAGQR